MHVPKALIAKNNHACVVYKQDKARWNICNEPLSDRVSVWLMHDQALNKILHLLIITTRSVNNSIVCVGECQVLVWQDFQLTKNPYIMI